MTPIQEEKWFTDRKSPRLAYYDYSTPNYYFITICTQNKKCIFGGPGQCNDIGKIAEKGFELIAQNYASIRIEKAVVMPNHVHAIVVLTDRQHDLSAIIGTYKSYVSRTVHQQYPDMQIWQRSFHEHIIRSQKSFEKIWEYIENNPLKWQEDCFYITTPL